jgi:hypothetical protein
MATDIGSSPISYGTQDIIEVADILNDLLLTKNGNVCLVLKTSSVNFDLLSEDEQDIKISSFGSMVNSLDFPLQILIETKKINISKYADYLDEMDTPDLSAGLKRQFVIYKHFIRNLITNKEILDKRFMIVIPYRTSSSISKTATVEQKKKIIESAVGYLYPKKYHIIKMVKGMGLEAEQMTGAELTKYLYSVFNPGQSIQIDTLPVIYT